jgi:dTDP-glucose 4,6-dehydratase
VNLADLEKLAEGRDWLCVKDQCEALLRVFESGRPGETYNIGGGTEVENIGIV